MNSERFMTANAAMLLIDYPIGTMSWVHSAPLDEIKINAVVLAKTVRTLNMPVILTAASKSRSRGLSCLNFRLFFLRPSRSGLSGLRIVDAINNDNLCTPSSPPVARI